ncbi:hypothetical protein Murru_2771 [Allomuricauda ruestringensis DSM 13258]|uniref:Lipoprotein n=1 Tax=Allomuricauda ruestringensis (strain DSM 13258 / CIP 107369 / LMG 19739 / B1) TaxID=886377 RepID=G2PIQ2_ALLRU|nr:hypothetical protein [Allomuricauda ruestringensis]AEM71797.1 hypothetical protein Murru_2771 [Allomuricauda ruestringensis DSM 13258]
MKQLFFLLGVSLFAVKSYACDKCKDYDNDDFQIKNVSVKHSDDIAATIWEITVKGTAGKTTPTPAGQMNGAPVLGYVFPTTLKSTDVGFGDTEGIVALALTSHPDFDDTPLWDENADLNFVNDGIVWHPHWVVLTDDNRVEGGLAVKQFDPKDTSVVLPPTNPGMPMYMDSPGFQVITNKNTIRVVVPDYRMNNKTNFSYDGVTAFMQVNTSGEVGGDKPMLGVYKVYSVASGDLSLPYKVK